MDQPNPACEAGKDNDDEIRVRCKSCGFVGTIDDFDVLLADEGKLFCHACDAETSVETVDESSGEPPTGA